MDVKPKGIIYKPKSKRAKKQLSFEEQSMSTIPDTWRRTLDDNFSVFRDNLLAEKVIEHMPFTDEQRNDMNAMVSNHQRTDYILKRVLPNGPKSLVEDFKNGLKLTSQEFLIPFTPGDGKGVKRSLSVDSGVSCNVPADDIPVMIHVNGHKYLKLMQHHDKTIINLREYITDLEGKLHPTKKGILLSLEDWQALVKVDISTLIEQKRIE